MEFCLERACTERYGLPLGDCDDQKIYALLLETVGSMIRERRQESRRSGRRLYYLCAEFLLGRLLSDHMMALGIYERAREQLFAAGKSPDLIEEMEKEPSLGNGGLGRLAACFLDSIATLGLPGDGVGLLYRFGLFRQCFCDLQQCERPEPWMEENGWLRKTDFAVTVHCMGRELRARQYALDILGNGEGDNTLYLFEPESIDPTVVQDEEGIRFDMSDIPHTLTLFLYPDDSTPQGRRLRLCQQYFLASCAAELILQDCHKRGWRAGVTPLSDYAIIQINDTHPALIIPVLIKALCDEGMEEQQAILQVQQSCAYTNHTVLSEALERWHLSDVEAVAPDLMPLLARMDALARQRTAAGGIDPEKCAVMTRDEMLAMAPLAIHFSGAVNGVAALHTALLKERVLPDFYALYPDRFTNKTNGITHRRWLLGCNRPLTRWLLRRIGDEFIRDATHLEKLEAYVDDEIALNELLRIKQQNKQRLCEYLLRTRALSLCCDGVFDIQIKRLHEYKRQQLNALYLIDKILSLRQGESLPVPLVAIFGAKAAPSYAIAKDILHLLLCLDELVGKDVACSGRLQIAVVENYNVSAAEYLMPACEISEQISLASKEASGTGNMKMMMNGALTLGTADGANIEILQRVGEDNMYLFGMSCAEVTSFESSGSYDPQAYYARSDRLRRAVDFIVSDELCAIGNCERLRRLHDALLYHDRFMAFADFEAYRQCRDRALSEYTDRMRWAKKMLINIARSGYFSSDRTVLEYNRDIWHLACGKEERE